MGCAYWYLMKRTEVRYFTYISYKGLVVAGLSDVNRPVESVSASQCGSLAATGVIWSRYSLVIVPKNYSLFAVNLSASKMRSALVKVTALVLLAACSAGGLAEDDHRIIRRQDLLASDSDVFEDSSTTSFSQLLFDVARDQVVVGARDALYRLSLRGLRHLERADWLAPQDKSQLCQDKGQTEEDCHNYIKVLLSHGHKLFACGTNAFSPVCSWREIESIGKVLEWVSGVAHCPYNPHSNVTALLAGNGDYYAGTPTDFTGSDTAICRSRGASIRDLGTLRSTQYDLSWLNEPQFAGSFEDDAFVYFVFREVAVEYMNCGKIIYSRIGRVCKNDAGGHLMMKDNWSTFLKARLNCSIPGSYPFYYDEVLSVEYLPAERLLVAAFTTPENSIAGSAVCVYNMSDITAAFDGPYKVKDYPTSTWEPRTPSQQARDHFNCIADTRPQQAVEYHRYHLMYESIQPISGEPVYKTTLERFTHITADVTQHDEKQLVVFVANEKSEVLKLAVLPNFVSACEVELWKLEDEQFKFDVLTMQFVKDTMSVYIGTSRGVVRLSAFHCSRYSRRDACLSSGDPHCGWDDSKETCRDYQPHTQRALSCATELAVVDGGWSSWSNWEPCVQDTPSQSMYGEDKPDMCMCRTRRCDNPKPTNGGLGCKGTSIAVTNCTVHGAWSPWSGWSSCSATCGIALKSRRRSCTAPEPRFGGRVCVGLDAQESFCSSLPPCPDPELAPLDGGWSAWSAWSPCAGDAGPGCGPAAGWRERRRNCSNPAPKYGGSECEGSKVDRQVCDLRPCEVRKATAWTPWVLIPGNTSDGSYMEKRFKFACKAPSPEQIRLAIAKEEDRYCAAGGSCSSLPPDDASEFDPWGAWSPCSATCGGGQQTRARACRGSVCQAAASMLRPCNAHACAGEWSCWSDWSECSGSCAPASTGHRTRVRQCLSQEGCSDAGAALEKRACVNTCADEDAGWSAWGAWSQCANGEQVRTRRCERGACVGAILQVAHCGQREDDIDNELSAMPAYSQAVETASFVTMPRGGDSMSTASIIGCIVAAFAMGCLVCIAGVIFWSHRDGSRLTWRHSRVPSSPHYITAKQNSYVTVPLKDVPRKAKRQPSFTGIGGGSGIILSKSNNLSNANNHNTSLTTPKLYPKAIANEYDTMGTLRRHSTQPSHKNNLDFEEDKFY